LSASLLVVGALLAKPSAVCVPLIAAVVDRFVLGRSWRASLLLLGPWMAVAAGVIWITRLQQPENTLLFAPALWARPLIAGDAMMFYLTKLVWPFNLGILYERSPKFVLAQWWSWVAWLVPTIVFALLVWRLRRTGLAIAGWFLAALLPVLGFVPFGHQGFSTVADRYMYLAMVAPAFALTCWLKKDMSGRRRALCVVTLAALAVITFLQCGHWRNSFALYEQALRVHPDSDAVHGELGREYFLSRQPDAAEKHLLRSHDLNPRNGRTVYFLALLLEQRGRLADAEQLYRQVLEMDSSIEHARVNLGALLMKRQECQAALHEFDEALRNEPMSMIAGFNRALALEQLGRHEEALQQFGLVVERYPEYYAARLKLGIQLAAHGHRSAAIEQFQYILSKQDDPGAHAELAAALLAQGDAHAAVQHYRQALAKQSRWWPQLPAGQAGCCRRTPRPKSATANRP
jgi:tetratricopeptide (TPR) repeat protein